MGLLVDSTPTGAALGSPSGDERLDLDLERLGQSEGDPQRRPELPTLEARDVVDRETGALGELRLRPAALLAFASNRLTHGDRELTGIPRRLGRPLRRVEFRAPTALLHTIILSDRRPFASPSRTETDAVANQRTQGMRGAAGRVILGFWRGAL